MFIYSSGRQKLEGLGIFIGKVARDVVGFDKGIIQVF